MRDGVDIGGKGGVGKTSLSGSLPVVAEAATARSHPDGRIAYDPRAHMHTPIAVGHAQDHAARDIKHIGRKYVT